MNTDERTQGGRPKWRGIILSSIPKPRYSILPPPPFPEEKLAEAISFCTSLSFFFFAQLFFIMVKYTKQKIYCKFPGGPVVKIPCFQCRGCEFGPWSRN